MDEIPTIDQIKAATELLSPEDATMKVVKIGTKFAVKFGRAVSLVEAESMRFVASNTSVPVPEVFATFSDPQTKINYIVMEFMPGQSLDIAKQLNDIMKNLREVEPPNYLGSVGNQALPDGVFWDPDLDKAITGPFTSESALNEGIIQHLTRTEAPGQVQLLRELISSTLIDHKAVFTHGDFQPKNIMIEEVGQNQDGQRLFKITVIDWENSGWYPEYWEFCNAMIGATFRPDWLVLLRRIL
ncbi:hypothetical protein BP5796_09700 [Coleophoma crateriformis]|uniref:Aminoglycoside phosphotransferase domain-containing protein n=1 Tax=Coleophoma crateriformis TaxID=565419 RepID=A0A3D8QZ63_9HELO|nr:hypothetical protein BP5796_09700 [Coleophoma crateriformis]